MSVVMNMVEFLKTEAPDPERAVAAKFVETAPFLRALPFETRAVVGVPFNYQNNLPSTTARAVGETYTPSQGQVDPGFEPMKLQGGISPFDAFQIATGSNRRAIEAGGFIESVGRNYVRDVFKGDDSADPRIIRGLQLRCATVGVNHITQAAGAATMIQVHRAINQCRRPTHIAMGKLLHTRFSVAASNTAVGGYITRGQDEFGKPIMVIAGLPVIKIDEDGTDTDILSFTETTSTTSLYVLSLGAEMMHGIQVAPPRAEDLGRDTSTGVRYNTLVDWYASFVVRHPRAAVRYSMITDVAVTL